VARVQKSSRSPSVRVAAPPQRRSQIEGHDRWIEARNEPARVPGPDCVGPLGQQRADRRFVPGLLRSAFIGSFSVSGALRSRRASAPATMTTHAGRIHRLVELLLGHRSAESLYEALAQTRITELPAEVRASRSHLRHRAPRSSRITGEHAAQHPRPSPRRARQAQQDHRRYERLVPQRTHLDRCPALPQPRHEPDMPRRAPTALQAQARLASHRSPGRPRPRSSRDYAQCDTHGGTCPRSLHESAAARKRSQDHRRVMDGLRPVTTPRF
jgi:hypothetical protein